VTRSTDTCPVIASRIGLRHAFLACAAVSMLGVPFVCRLAAEREPS
jgi:hypothetical protein